MLCFLFDSIVLREMYVILDLFWKNIPDKGVYMTKISKLYPMWCILVTLVAAATEPFGYVGQGKQIVLGQIGRGRQQHPQLRVVF